MRRVARAVLLSASLLVVSACSNIGGTGDLDYISGDGKVVLVDEGDREEPLEISGTTVQGEPLDVTDLRGKVVVLNVWWSGCGPCRTEMPMLVDADKELAEEQPDQVAFVGINIRDLAAETAAAFERDRGVDYPSLYDPGSETLLDMGRYAPYAPPATLVLDREGRVAALINGAIPSKTTLTSLVEDTLAETDG
ncbi:TlpA family protein disulfide reductase [Nocardioides carbamazepini]|uniref:TlpA disulfide reductase family protein n=1 Tax=Nocardioides carbamazepini TaxID=2854259 RepID=UPI00214A8A11|nr:TlpA disulfide reductase family protein [Nocardioides carbamazepini]MCR1783616.1 TlpA family protein disulfide reductase [Nocardioides carbamazepini]